MPLYEYSCHDCRARFEVLQRMGEGAEAVHCPECGAARPERRLSTFATAVGGSSPASRADAGGCGRPACGSGFT